MKELQAYHQRCFQLKDITVGRYEVIDYHMNNTLVKPSTINYSLQSEKNKQLFIDIPRFTVTLLDAATVATRSCAVFIIPTGRESEYHFSTKDGLLDMQMANFIVSDPQGNYFQPQIGENFNHYYKAYLH